MNSDRYFFKDIPLIIPSKYNATKNSYTIFIGNNGVGKSRLLDALSRSLIEETIQHEEHIEHKGYLQDFISNFSSFQTPDLARSKIGTSHTPNDVFPTFLESALIVPAYHPDESNDAPKVITVSTSPFDSFKLPTNRTLERKNLYKSNYRYIGMRGSNTNSSASISLLNSASSGLIEKLLHNENFDRLAKVFDVLNFDPSLEFAFKPTYTFLSSTERFSSVQETKLFRFIKGAEITSDIEERLSIQVDAKLRSTLENLPNEIIQELTISLKTIDNFFSSKSHFKLKAIYRNKWNYNFNGEFENNYLILNAIQTLLKYNLIKLMDLRLSKPSNHEISLRRASSGEQCMLVIMLGIAGHITDHSNIFIDEPEISLHPKWQEKFMSLLIEVFSTYSGCRFYIATHSPQIISNLSEDNCFITSLANKEIFHANDYKDRSADFQLAELFDAPGSMNEYLIRMAFGLISRIKATKNITTKDSQEIKKLNQMADKLEQDDPLLELIKTVFEMNKYYASNK